jgi:UDP-N-acetylglucosamine 2-epimerase (non-hydrolysing)
VKIMTVLGTRPEIIRLSRLIPKLDSVCTHVLVNTGQNFDPRLSQIFFDELGVRSPDFELNIRADSAAEQIGRILVDCDRLFAQERPDRLVILGDTNSALCSIVAKRRGIPVFHLEAGNRCFDDRVPEEVNRRLVDHSSDILMPYTERSRDNLIREGVSGSRIFVIGNPINEVLTHYQPKIESSHILSRLGLARGGFFLVTLHRAENVDDKERLSSYLVALRDVAALYGLPVVVSLHPRTRVRMREFGLSDLAAGLQLIEPLGFFDYVQLEQTAKCVLSDSGTVQEECAIFRVPNVTLRDVTERPETIECGSNILAGCAPASIMRAVSVVLSASPRWTAPGEYLATAVSDTVCRILAGHHEFLTVSR